MFGLGSIIGFVGLGLSLLGVVGQYMALDDRSDALDRAAAERQKANELAKRKQAIQKRRESLAVAREARIKRARALSMATTKGAAGSVRGGFGSFISQGSAQTQFLNQYTGLTSQQNAFLAQSSLFSQKAREAGETATIFGSIGGLGGSIFDRRKELATLV